MEARVLSSSNTVDKPSRNRILKRVMKTTFSKPATEMYPKQKPCLEKDYRGKPIFDFSACIGCGICSRECPSKAIEMVQCDKKRALNLTWVNVCSVITVQRFAQKNAFTTLANSNWQQPINPR